ncbi:MAG: protein kinase [Chloroflexi bacterium]|nr:protein kinase [Chloroflexota bacterium]
MELKPGDNIGEYTVLDMIGDGGYSVVYKAEDTNLLRPVAIKQFSPEVFSETGTREWFVREARLSASLNHPNIVATYALREQADNLFLVMEYLPGGDLHTLIEENGPLSRSVLLKVASNVCHALETLHARNIIHRDIKPENILIAQENHFKLADFGLAHIHHHQARLGSANASSGPQPGTLLYMSPEQAFGHEVTVRSDIYSLAVVLYEAMTGHYYFDYDYMTEDDDALLQLIAEESPLPIDGHHDSVPPALGEPLLRALSKDPEERPATAREFLNEIKNAVSRSKRSTLTQKRRRIEAQPPLVSPELLQQLYTVRTLRDADNQLDEAQQRLQLIWEMSPGVPEVAAEWGETLLAHGDVEGGLGWIERALRIKPDLPFAQLALAEALRNTEQDEEADDAIIEAIHADPDLVYAVLYDDIVAELDDPPAYEAFVTLFQRAAEDQPSAAVYHNLGQVLALDPGSEEDSITAFETAMSIDPQYGPAYVGLASLLSQLERLGDAIELLDQASYQTFPELPPDDWHKANTVYQAVHAHLALALAYAEVGQFENSAIAACTVLDLDPSALEDDGPILLDAYLQAVEDWIRAKNHLRAYKFLNQIIPLAAHWGNYRVFMLLGLTQGNIGAEFRRKRQWEDAVQWLKNGLASLRQSHSNGGDVEKIAVAVHKELKKAQQHE